MPLTKEKQFELLLKNFGTTGKTTLLLLDNLAKEAKPLVAAAILEFHPHWDNDIGEFITKEAKEKFLGIPNNQNSVENLVRTLFLSQYYTSIAWAEFISETMSMTAPPKAVSQPKYPFPVEDSNAAI